MVPQSPGAIVYASGPPGAKVYAPVVIQVPGQPQGDAPASAEPARDARTPGGQEIQAPGKPLGDALAPVGDLEPAKTADIPQLDGADPDLDTLFDPHSGQCCELKKGVREMPIPRVGDNPWL